MSKGETYRNEWKYLIDTAQKELICQRLGPFLKLDKHASNGGYMIRSLYFDDYYQSAYEEKDAGVLKRKKYRIRIYNCSDNSIKLERKKKYGAYIFKESASLTREEVYKILDGDYEFLLHSDKPLCREFYVECVSNVMRPRTIVDYDREPWILDEGTVRITFDIERVFADAKEKHAMRYTHHRGLAAVTRWVRLKYAAMNLKKLANWSWNNSFFSTIYLLISPKCAKTPVFA